MRCPAAKFKGESFWNFESRTFYCWGTVLQDQKLTWYWSRAKYCQDFGIVLSFQPAEKAADSHNQEGNPDDGSCHQEHGDRVLLVFGFTRRHWRNDRIPASKTDTRFHPWIRWARSPLLCIARLASCWLTLLPNAKPKRSRYWISRRFDSLTLFRRHSPQLNELAAETGFVSQEEC